MRFQPKPPPAPAQLQRRCGSTEYACACRDPPQEVSACCATREATTTSGMHRLAPDAALQAGHASQRSVTRGARHTWRRSTPRTWLGFLGRPGGGVLQHTSVIYIRSWGLTQQRALCCGFECNAVQSPASCDAICRIRQFPPSAGSRAVRGPWVGDDDLLILFLQHLLNQTANGEQRCTAPRCLVPLPMAAQCTRSRQRGASASDM